MKNTNNKNQKSKGSEKKLYMRIIVLAVCIVMILGIIILPLI